MRKNKMLLIVIHGLILSVFIEGMASTAGQTATSESLTLAISTVSETETSSSSNSVTFVVVNNSSLSVIAVNLGTGDSKGNKISSSIPVEKTLTIQDINPTDYTCLDIVKSNDKKDCWCMGLKGGKTYTFTIKDAENDYATLTVINKTSEPIVTVDIAGKNWLSSPILPGEQGTIRKIPPSGLKAILIADKSGMGSLWGMTLEAGEMYTYVME